VARRLLWLTALIIAEPASASTPAAWAQMDRQVDRACRTAADLQRARVQPDKASFADTVPVELRIVEGYNRRGVIDVKLCAYNRRTGRVAITDAAGRLGVSRR